MGTKVKFTLRSLMQICILVSSLLMVDGQSKNVVVYSVHNFTADNPEETFYHMAVRNNGDVYISTQKSIYRLTDSLEIICKNDTCSSKDCVNNINKVLVIDYKNNRLVTCGGYEGRCESRSLDELTYNIEDSAERVVSINDLSAVGYIASKTIASKTNQNYLYVAATDDGNMGSSFSTISIRSLNNFNVLDGNNFGVNDVFKNKIKYVSGFSYQEYRYFVANIIEQVGGTEESFPRLSRICDKVNIDHLSDVYLKCVDGATSYKAIKAVSLGLAGPDLASSLGMNSTDYVLYAVFFNSNSKNSALCIYKWSDIETAFEDALFGCATKDSDLYKLNYAKAATCSGIKIDRIEISDYFCKDISSWSSYSQGINNEAALSHAVVVLPNCNLTAVTTVIERNHTIAFLGTADGHLLKAHLVSDVSARMFEDVTLAEGSMVRSDMFVSDDNKTLLALTEKKVFKLHVENCAQYTTCNECIGPDAGEDGDPYCGWCTLEKNCTTYEVCSTGPWLPFNEAQCVSITQVTPPNLEHGQEPTTLAIKVQNLPPLTDAGQYKCIFNKSGMPLDAVLANQTLECKSPELQPPIPEGTDHVSVQLSIFATATRVEFVETSYDFYACNAHQGCTDCVSSEWGCNWCVFKNTCTKNPDEVCAEEPKVIGGDNGNATQCPQIVSGQSEELHVEVPVEFKINTMNIPSSINNFYCEVEIMDDKNKLSAMRDRQNNNTIVCGKKSFVYSEEKQSVNATVTILWEIDGSLATLDNAYIVKLYNCSVGRPDCSRCLSNSTAPPSLHCVWCGPSTGCTVDEKCLKEITVCPAPTITKIIPSTVATMAGITTVDYVTLEGIDFGQDETDIVSVKIGGKSSELVNGMYEVGKSVKVSAPAFETPMRREVYIEVRGSDGEIRPSGEAFMLDYQSPEITGFSPKLGPLSGGVNVNIDGKLLRTGSEQKVMIGKSVCKIWNITDTMISCETTESNSTGSKDVTVNFALASRKANNKFEYKKDPNVTQVYPDSSIKSGGRNLTVEGYGFDTIQNPKVIVTLGDQTFEAECKDIISKTIMFCPTPNLSSATLQKRVKRQAEGEPAMLGFKFANVQDLLTWSRNSDFQFKVYEDPIYYKFNNTKEYGDDVIDGGVFYLKEDTVSLRGERLNSASNEEDVLVYIGDKMCEVTILSSEELQCSAPKSPPNKNRLGVPTKNYPLVTVVHGNLVVIIGPIKYHENPAWLTPVIVVGVLAVLAIFLCMFVFFHCKTKKIEKDKERMLEEMELLEESVREDSRRAIAELTTNLDDLTTELEGTGMPFLSMLDYMKKMMFEGYEKVPADYGADTQNQNAHGLKEFAKLLSKKDFLLSFIEMIEENRNISNKQKGNFASLLTVGMIAERKLPYFTEVLTSLLENYITDGVALKRGKLLFRRTESVTEKLLSNWIALCMYDHLKDHAGYPLYLLYQAIKCKVWKGPVDAVTYKSYHSLSIDYLFKENVDFEEMNLKVSMDKSDKETFSVSVLTCDCISQVKEKILDAMYKSRPYSSRPSASNVDLDLRAGNQGHLVLSDIDNTSKVSGHWRQLNTLRYLKIKDGATVSLLHRANGRHSAAPGDIVTNTNPLYENTINMDAKYGFCAEDFNLERGVQPWHLVKELDIIDEEHRNSRKKNQGSMYRRKLKTIQEVHFPRLMSTKTTIQKYVDRMFEAVLKAPSDDSNMSVPLTIKYIFDFFDKQAEENDVGGDMAKTWKNNSLVQRFWVTVITHPNFIFDILQTLPVEAALEIIAGTLMDSCAVEAIKYTKDTSTNRLLYTREVPKYRDYVDRFYSSIQKMPTATSNFLNEELECVNENFLNKFSHLSTLQHLYSYAERDRAALMDVLDQGMHIDMKEQFQQVELAMQQDQD